MRSPLEELLVWQLRVAGIPDPVREHRFFADRRWRFDFAWPKQMLAVEVEGGVWSNGRHTRPAGFLADIEKYNRATLLGWRVLRVTGEEIRGGSAVAIIIEGISAE